jgi:hypothetical protein
VRIDPDAPGALDARSMVAPATPDAHDPARGRPRGQPPDEDAA